MRIRKDKKLAQLGLSPDAVHLCQLNQSPWDVPSTTAHLRTSSFQVGGGHEEDTGNGTLLPDSLGAFDSSVASMESMRYEDELEDGNGIGIGIGLGREEDKDVVSCSKSSKVKGWQCKQAAKQGEPMCRHHLKSPPPPPPSAKKNKVGRGRVRPAKKEDNPYTFYYYTGFGPTWGRKRSDAQSQSPAHHHAPIPILYDEDDDDEDSSSSSSGKEEEKESDTDTDSESDGARKRTRRPVKERSLKSLM